MNRPTGPGPQVLEKKDINLAQREGLGFSIGMLLAGLVIIGLLAGAVSKFGVIDQFDRLQEARQTYGQLQAQLQQYEKALSGYDEVKKDYHTHAGAWTDANDTLLQVLELLDQTLMQQGELSQLSFQDHRIELTLSGLDLQQITQVVASLQESPFIQRAELQTASGSDSRVQCRLILYLETGEESQ